MLATIEETHDRLYNAADKAEHDGEPAERVIRLDQATRLVLEALQIAKPLESLKKGREDVLGVVADLLIVAALAEASCKLPALEFRGAELALHRRLGAAEEGAAQALKRHGSQARGGSRGNKTAELRDAIAGGHVGSHEQIARKFGVSRDTVRRIKREQKKQGQQ